jgi:hypothetical protein
MEMLRDSLRPEQLAQMRRLIEGETQHQQFVSARQKRDFEEEADRKAFAKRRARRAAVLEQEEK